MFWSAHVPSRRVWLLFCDSSSSLQCGSADNTCMHKSYDVQLFERLVDVNRALPWEDSCIEDRHKQRMGRFLEPIRGLLHRDPETRFTVQNFRDEMGVCLRP